MRGLADRVRFPTLWTLRLSEGSQCRTGLTYSEASPVTGARRLLSQKALLLALLWAVQCERGCNTRSREWPRLTASKETGSSAPHMQGTNPTKVMITCTWKGSPSDALLSARCEPWGRDTQLHSGCAMTVGAIRWHVHSKPLRLWYWYLLLSDRGLIQHIITLVFLREENPLLTSLVLYSFLLFLLTAKGKKRQHTSQNESLNQWTDLCLKSSPLLSNPLGSGFRSHHSSETGPYWNTSDLSAAKPRGKFSGQWPDLSMHGVHRPLSPASSLLLVPATSQLPGFLPIFLSLRLQPLYLWLLPPVPWLLTRLILNMPGCH